MKKDHSKPTHIGNDLWAVLDGSCTALVVVIAASVLQPSLTKAERYSMIVLIIVACIALVLLLSKKASSKLTNKTGKRIYCKDEDSDEVFEVPDGGTAYDIDGFFVEGSRRVHKLTDGVHIIVKSEDNLSATSLSGTIANRLRDNLGTTAPDNGWKPLFDKTKEAPK